MPYVDQLKRNLVDKHIEALAQAVQASAETPDKPWTEVSGLMNYCITRFVMLLLPYNIRYWQIALMTGMLENVKQEFYRRVASPYEDKQKDLNGDVYND